MEAGRRRVFHTYAVPWNLLLIIIVISSFTKPCLSSSIVLSSPSDQLEEEKVTLALYYETLCPYCSNLIVNYLYKVFDDGLIDIVDLKLIPYGNAKIGPNNTITCQHGPTECLLNTIEACAIHVWPDLNEHFPFIYCIETLIYEGNYQEWESCFKTLNLDPTPVTECYSSGYGDKLELRYAAETNSLQPRHTFVPWVVVNGQPLYDDYRDFISFICKAYKGTNVPRACSKSYLGSIQVQRANHIDQVCYTEETTKSTLPKIRSAVTSWMRQANMAVSV